MLRVNLFVRTSDNISRIFFYRNAAKGDAKNTTEGDAKNATEGGESQSETSIIIIIINNNKGDREIFSEKDNKHKGTINDKRSKTKLHKSHV